MADELEAHRQGPLWQAVVAGSVGGLMCTVVGHPFETVKVRLQMGNTRHLFRRLYAGVLSPVAGITPVWALGYFSWRAGLVMLPDDMHPLVAAGAAGSFAGLVECIVKTPVEAVKTVAQHEHTTTRAAAQKLWRDAGIRGLYRGSQATVYLMVPSQWFYYITYCHFNDEKQLPVSNHMLRCFIAGGLAGVAEWATCMPLDVVKTRVQAGNYPTWFAGAEAVYKDMGFRGFYRGFVPTMLRSFPANGAGWMGLELANDFFHKLARDE